MELRILGPRVYLGHHRDPQALLRLWNDPNVMTSVGWPKGLGVSPDYVQQWIASSYPVRDPARQNYRLAIYDQAADAFMGETALGYFGRQADTEPDLKLLPEYWGQGYGTEVVNLVTDFLFTMTACPAIRFTPNIHNKAAIRVYEKCGFIDTGERITWEPPPEAAGAVAVTAACLRLTKADHLSVYA